MLFDEHGRPMGEDEYRERLLSMTMLLVQCGGGRMTVTGKQVRELQELQGGHLLTQEPTEDGGFTLTIMPMEVGT
jgi:hypothetical protein